MYRKATIWKVSLESKSGQQDTLHVMSPGASFYDLGDLSKMLFEAAKEFGIDPDSNITGIEKACVAFGLTKLPKEGALALREDGSIVVNDPAKLAAMAGIEPDPNWTTDSDSSPAYEVRKGSNGEPVIANVRNPLDEKYVDWKKLEKEHRRSTLDLRAVAGTPLAATAEAAEKISQAVERGSEVYERSLVADKKAKRGSGRSERSR